MTTTHLLASKVSEVTLYFWTIKILGTTVVTAAFVIAIIGSVAYLSVSSSTVPGAEKALRTHRVGSVGGTERETVANSAHGLDAFTAEGQIYLLA